VATLVPLQIVFATGFHIILKTAVSYWLTLFHPDDLLSQLKLGAAQLGGCVA
jgi:hypothetical protein